MEIILNVIGIILNTTGVVLIFIFGLSPLVHTGTVKFIYSESENNSNSKSLKKKKLYRNLSITGLMLCCVGAFLQIIALLV